MRERNQLNNPYNKNKEYAKKTFGSNNATEKGSLADTNSRYDYEFSKESEYDPKNSPLARGANIANAFSYPIAGSAEAASLDGDFAKYNEEYTLAHTDNAAIQREVNEQQIKKRYQEHLRQNYNVEFSDEDLIDNKR